MNSISFKTKLPILTTVFLSVILYYNTFASQAFDTDQELQGIGMEKGWVLVEGIGTGGGNASSRRERAYHNALDSYVKSRLLFTSTDQQRYATVRDSFLSQYADFLVKDQNGDDFHYGLIEKGRNAQNEEFTHLYVLIQRDAIVTYLENQNVIEKIAVVLNRIDNPKILFLPEHWQNLSQSNYEKALQRFEGILSKRGLHLISSQEIKQLWIREEALKKIMTQAKRTAQNNQVLLSHSGADILVLYQIDTSQTDKTQTTVFYQSKLKIRVIDNNSGEEKQTWQYQSRNWGLALNNADTLQDATILEVIHPAADEIATFLRQQWAELKSGKIFTLNLKGSQPQHLEHLSKVFTKSCHIQMLTLQQARLRCPLTQSEFEEILMGEEGWSVQGVHPFVLDLSGH